jgi:hypothetical protein
VLEKTVAYQTLLTHHDAELALENRCKTGAKQVKNRCDDQAPDLFSHLFLKSQFEARSPRAILDRSPLLASPGVMGSGELQQLAAASPPRSPPLDRAS